jgi:hypothetical protein
MGRSAANPSIGLYVGAALIRYDRSDTDDMRVSFVCYILLAVGLSGPGLLPAQQLDGCEVDYRELQTPIEVSEEGIHPGTMLYLSEGYLSKLAQGTYEEVNSELRYYLFVRPASNKEIRKDKIKGNPKERIGRDQNVYIDLPIPSSTHFFETTPAFAGHFEPNWHRQEMLLPIGVAPLDITTYANAPMTVLARQADYLLLEVEGKQVTFYRGFPPLGEVFDTEAVRQQLKDRAAQAQQWIGRALLIRQPHEVVPPPDGQSGSWAWAENLSRPQMVQSVISVSRQGVEWAMADQRVTLALNGSSQVRVFEADCVAQRKEAYLDSLRKVFSRQEVQMEMFAAVPANDWADNEDLRRHLAGRFGPIRWPDSTPTYRYLLQPARSNEPHVYPQVQANGDCWLVSHYLSEEGLFHTQLRVFVGIDSLETQRVSTIDRRNQRSYRGPQIIEEVVFDQPQNRAIMEAIAQASERPVRIKFIAGGDFYQAARLPALYRSAIRDAWMWAQTLKNSQ